MNLMGKMDTQEIMLVYFILDDVIKFNQYQIIFILQLILQLIFEYLKL